MTRVSIECLSCGGTREIGGSLDHAMEAGSCPCCGYVGWAFSTDLSERDRRLLRDLPLEHRRFELPPGLLAVQ